MTTGEFIQKQIDNIEPLKRFLMPDNPIAVVTTINPPTKQVKTLASKIPVIVVGDKKTPPDWSLDNTAYINPDEAPFNHYARKNFGYLEAIRMGATVIYDTDDDNEPHEDWCIRGGWVSGINYNGGGWANVYNHFAGYGWPRGFALSQIATKTDWGYPSGMKYCPVQQGLSNGSPDVDAIYRLTEGGALELLRKQTIILSRSWCPFNSQSTWWFPEAYCLMYLPEFATFRMCDIWRSFVAQRCLWEIGAGVAFHSPAEVFQERNPHDLMKDFEDEIPGYLYNERIAETLGGLTLTGNIPSDMATCYEAMVQMGVLSPNELISLGQWLQTYAEITNADMGRLKR